MSTKTVNSVINAGKSYQYVDNGEPMRGGMKDVYFSPDKSYVVAFYRDAQDYASRERLRKIVTDYYNSFFNREGGDYYRALYCWPTDMVEADKKVGLVVPCYHANFFFKKGYASNDLIKGKEKEGKWFASPKFRNKQFTLRLDEAELGNWLSYFQIGVNISRGVKRLHAAGLAHSDLSYKNVLVDPVSKSATIIDIDGLVVPGLFPPDVIGTADFIAPEVLATKHLDLKDPGRKLPNRLTDLHALAVMIYMYLLYRHPLKGGKIHDLDAEKDDLLAMGEKALFIEHPQDTSNRPKLNHVNPKELPWADVNKLPYTITGPYLKELFYQAFVTGLHQPTERPPAEMWEQALLKTTDLMQPCSNAACEQKWYVFDNTHSPKCPFCGTPHKGTLPVLDLYYEFKPTVWKPENHRLMVYNNQYLFQWHVNRNTIRNERITAAQKVPVGYFVFHQGKWVLVNQQLTSLKDLTEDKEIPIGAMVELTDGKRLLLSREEGGRVVIITIANK
ncbi:helix-hairpin-helix domain-containing protein [Chitinophaga ginsengisegetis]|uniref:helix-hairpin-helix domain-containing protein n=1 Tax=Chitinophaga ginsengisegetis TaxID=393003 RepID=UPI000DBA7EB5|nr:kinase [Chitinophaga ginsengisegetis]MDR6570018.1 serine/threonine protein kinase [Chitinophaga ginsengisegetis]MDR6649751.1 serine/threonine protein kinase [Chitinophaga ginsengisegetis]MDR6656046.1 serine/threonine protein kinase [Chitinophaga ginsengisegetis]